MVWQAWTSVSPARRHDPFREVADPSRPADDRREPGQDASALRVDVAV
jgi:hypothetical protein